MKVIRAEHLGMCFGVRDAIALAQQQSQAEHVTVLGELVHNESVLAELRRRGIQFQNDPQDVAPGSTVMITAHGASVRRINATRELGLNVVSAACPLVHAAHRAAAKLVHEGFHLVVIGRRDHVEVRGLTEDFDSFDVVLTEADMAQLTKYARIGIVAQTTQPIEKVRYLANLIREKFPRSEIQFIDTVCQPTKQRQNSAIELAQKCDVVVVIGGANSNNTRELVNTCGLHCARVHHVRSDADIREEWFRAEDTVGITAGTSTPDSVIEGVEKRLRGFVRHASANAQEIKAVESAA
jgi:4-hydroxy-3-methylbut-2-enyl diphosphate reductase